LTIILLKLLVCIYLNRRLRRLLRAEAVSLRRPAALDEQSILNLALGRLLSNRLTVTLQTLVLGGFAGARPLLLKLSLRYLHRLKSVSQQLVDHSVRRDRFNDS